MKRNKHVQYEREIDVEDTLVKSECYDNIHHSDIPRADSLPYQSAKNLDGDAYHPKKWQCIICDYTIRNPYQIKYHMMKRLEYIPLNPVMPIGVPILNSS